MPMVAACRLGDEPRVQLAAVVKTRLKRIQSHPALLDGFLRPIGLVLQPAPP
jgi:hypothetical protein